MLAAVIEPTFTPTAPDLRRSPLLYGIAALWLLLWTMVALMEFGPSLHDPRVPHWQPIVNILISPVVVGSWLGWVLATRRFERPSIDPPRAWLRRHLRPLPLLIVGCIPLVYGMRWLFYGLIGVRVYGGPPINLMIPFEAFKISLFYGLWLTLMFGLLTLVKWREDSERMLAVQKALAEAQLAQLQAQLRPHFLFNALNTVSSLMQTDTARADIMLSQLGDLLRVPCPSA